MRSDNPLLIALLVLALLVGIAVGVVYLQKNVSANCTDFLFWRHCGVTTPR